MRHVHGQENCTCAVPTEVNSKYTREAASFVCQFSQNLHSAGGVCYLDSVRLGHNPEWVTMRHLGYKFCTCWELQLERRSSADMGDTRDALFNGVVHGGALLSMSHLALPHKAEAQTSQSSRFVCTYCQIFEYMNKRLSAMREHNLSAGTFVTPFTSSTTHSKRMLAQPMLAQAMLACGHFCWHGATQLGRMPALQHVCTNGHCRSFRCITCAQQQAFTNPPLAEDAAVSLESSLGAAFPKGYAVVR